MNIPLDIYALLQPMPEDFAPSIQEMDTPRSESLFLWREILHTPDNKPIVLEYAIHADTPTNPRLNQMKRDIWTAKELVRLNQLQYIKHMLPDRHRRPNTMINRPEPIQAQNQATQAN